MPLKFKTLKECSTTKARLGVMSLKHGNVSTPVFMPVGTQGTMKAVLPEQLVKMGCEIILGNTYHLAMRPGTEILSKVGGLHKFMNWHRCILTDSGGFQMVSLSKLAEVTEDGVKFVSPYDDTECILTPEAAIATQNIIGADIIMQLDDVVKTTTTGPRMEEAMHRTVRWLDRCISAHTRDDSQSIFPITQGGLSPNLRKVCVSELTKRNVRGFAIGGLSGGECKEDFWSTVSICTDLLPSQKPRYLMGVGFAADLIVCVALGVDMFDCVFPTRTARFGCALTNSGQMNLKHKKYELDLRPIDETCKCSTCSTYTRSYLHHIANSAAVSNIALTVHNIHYQMQLMRSVRESLADGTFPEFVRKFMKEHFQDENVPSWICEALKSVNIKL